MKAASVSVIVPVWNGAAYLRECLDNILGQTQPPKELIVVDDGSTDETPAILKSYGDRIVTIRQPQSGQSAATMAGIDRASGLLLAFQDCDDLWPADKLEVQLKALSDSPELEAVFGMSEQFVSEEHSDNPRLEPRETVLVGKITQCMLIHREAFDRVGPFDTSIRTAQFFDWLSRAEAAGLRYEVLDRIVHHRRLHPDNHGRVNTKARDLSLLSALHKNISRRRNEGEQN